MCKVWVANDAIYQARHIDDAVNDGADRPDDKKIKWVIFRVFTTKSGIDYDAVGYAESIHEAKEQSKGWNLHCR